MKNSTKHLAILCLLFLANSLRAQMYYMPDPQLRSYLSAQGYTACITGDSIDGSCPAVQTATHLQIISGNVTDLMGIEAFVNLIGLDIRNNNIATLNYLPPLLMYFTYSNNLTAALPALPVNLQTMYCDRNQFTSLPTLPSTLQELDCSFNLLTSIPALPASLLDLSCYNNSITVLPTLPNGLEFLSCSDNLFTALPALPATLQYLDAANNQLSSLPPLSSALDLLMVSNNNLTSLPNLPSQLGILSCDRNPLDSLPNIPITVFNLDCSHCNLTSLPILPDSMNIVDCSSNPLLNNIPNIPRAVGIFNCNSNPNVHCLPKIGRITSILMIDSTGIQCISGYDFIDSSTPPINTFPICDLYNINNCSFFWNINGATYFDADSNCVKDTNETSLRNIPVKIYKNGQFLEQVSSDAFGEYYFDADTNDIYSYFVDTTNIPYSVICPATLVYTDTLTVVDTLSIANNFGFKCNTNMDDATVWSVVSTRIRPGNASIVTVNAGYLSSVFGYNCGNTTNGTVSVSWNGSLIYTGTPANGIIPTTINSNSLDYTIADFTNLGGDLKFNLFADTSTVIGSQICFHVTVTANGDTIHSNDTMTVCFTVRGSFDPNDKTVFPDGNIDSTLKDLTYTIRFQNTGTDTAYNIHIIDTLDNNINPESFAMLSSSHPSYVHLYEGRIVKFSFPNIYLPDSFVNEPLSHGYVQYKVRLKNNLPIGTQVSNTAHIYFDYNAAVVTNSTLNTVSVITSVSSPENSSFSVWPNPFKEEINIYSDAFAGETSYVILDILGNEVLRGEFVSKQKTIQVHHLSKGVYFLRIADSKNYSVQKIIKQ